jgi:2-C-methyl-D-erythritol 4-phosphate cytidylyltransferase
VTAAAIVLGAGQGIRIRQGRPKALLRLAGRSLLEWSAEALGLAPRVRAVVVVVPPGHAREVREIALRWAPSARLAPPVEGGATRQDSLDAGLRALEREVPEAQWVLVHDAARCLVLPEDAERVLDSAAKTGAAIPVIPVSDTLKEVEGERVLRTLDRARVVAVQTPEAFRRSLLREALDKAGRDGFRGTDCASLVERLGVAVATCPGRPENFKVTLPEDLLRAEAILLARSAGIRAGERPSGDAKAREP